jgi:carbamoyl-phosphate synthase small subunit
MRSALTRRIRELGMPKAAICHQPEGGIDFKALVAAAQGWAGLDNADLAADVVQEESFEHTEGLWKPGTGHQAMGNAEFHTVVVDFGVKKNILRNLASAGARLDVPLHHIDAAYVRSHFDAMEVGVSDGPRPDELALILVMGDGPRVHARMGGLKAADISVWDGQR